MVGVFSLCNVKDFLSISLTCKQLHQMTDINNQNNKYLRRINQYWCNQCKVLCLDFSNEYKDVNTNFDIDYKIDWYKIYRDLIVIISNMIAIKYKLKIDLKLDTIMPSFGVSTAPSDPNIKRKRALFFHTDELQRQK